jgi:hypothetical protein
MSWTIERGGPVLTLTVTDPKIGNTQTVLSEIRRELDAGGISEIHVGVNETAWSAPWVPVVLSAFEVNMAAAGILVRVIGHDPRRKQATRSGSQVVPSSRSPVQPTAAASDTPKMPMTEGESCPSCGSERVALQGRLFDGRSVRELICMTCKHLWPAPESLASPTF